MTHPLLLALIPLVADLSRDLPDDERYRRLLRSLRQLFPCDAVALLKLEDDVLVPLSVEGLSPDTLGRRFRLGEHPRLDIILHNREPTRFSTDCDLPDPSRRGKGPRRRTRASWPGTGGFRGRSDRRS